LMMQNDKLDWLQKLGDAFLAQQNDVMAGIQRLRARAEANGQLKSTPEQKVIVEPAAAAPPPTVAQAPPAQTTVQVAQAPPTIIKIEQPNPQGVYVPSYDPTVVYGAFPEAYPPYYPYPPGYFAAGAFTFAAGMAVGAALWSDCDWHSGGGDVNVNNSTANNFTNNVNNRNEARNRVEHYNSQRRAGVVAPHRRHQGGRWVPGSPGRRVRRPRWWAGRAELQQSWQRQPRELQSLDWSSPWWWRRWRRPGRRRWRWWRRWPRGRSSMIPRTWSVVLVIAAAVAPCAGAAANAQAPAPTKPDAAPGATPPPAPPGPAG